MAQTQSFAIIMLTGYINVVVDWTVDQTLLSISNAEPA